MNVFLLRVCDKDKAHCTKSISYSCITVDVALRNEIITEAWNNASITFRSNHTATT